jgi:hypothetical protein
MLYVLVLLKHNGFLWKYVNRANFGKNNLRSYLGTHPSRSYLGTHPSRSYLGTHPSRSYLGRMSAKVRPTRMSAKVRPTRMSEYLSGLILQLYLVYSSHIWFNSAKWFKMRRYLDNSTKKSSNLQISWKTPALLSNL